MSTSNCEENPIAERIKEYENVVLSATNEYEWSIEKLIDLLIVLFDECCNSSLRRDKNVSDFINRGMYYIYVFCCCKLCTIKQCCRTFINVLDAKKIFKIECA